MKTVNPTIGVAIAGTTRNVSQLEHMLVENKHELLKFDVVVTVLQLIDDTAEHLIERFVSKVHEITYVEVQYDTGISKSRNRAVEFIDKDYVWFLDDDVRIVEGAASYIRNGISTYGVEGLCFRMGEWNSGKELKKYPKEGILKCLRVLRVSSIEIVVKKKFLAKNGIKFDETLGLGTSRPGGEENCFLLDIINCGGRIVHIGRVIVRHPSEDRNIRKTLNDARRTRAMGIVARRLNLLGFFVLLRWLARATLLRMSWCSRIEMVKGYVTKR